MTVSALQQPYSWSTGQSPMILGEVFDATKSIAVWRRSKNGTIANYFQTVFASLGMGLRGVYAMSTLKVQLSNALPDAEGKNDTVDDIYLLSDMLTCLFDCDSVGLRLAPLNKAMCPKFHTDNVPVRLVNTYLGEGTQWIPAESLINDKSLPENAPHANCSNGESSANSTNGYVYHPDDIKQLTTCDVALLKGTAWSDKENPAAIHRSCPVSSDSMRVLLTLDPM